MSGHYGRDVAYSAAARLITIGTSFALIWAFNHGLGRETYGVYALAGAWFSMAVVVASAGLDQLVLYRASGKPSDGESELARICLRLVMPTAALVGSVYLGLGVLKTASLGLPSGHLLFAGLALAMPATAASLVYSAWHQARRRFVLALLVPRMAEVTRMAALITAALLLPAPWLYATVLALSAWLPVVIYASVARHPDSGAGALDREDRAYALRMMFVRGLRSAVDNVDILMVGMLTSAAMVAGYALGSRLAAFALLGNQLIGQIALPRLGAALASERLDAAHHEMQRHLWYALLAATVFTTAMAPLASEIVTLFGTYQDAVPVAHVLLAAHVMACSFGPVGNALKMGGHARPLMASTWLLLLLLVTTNAALIPLLGMVGAAYGTFFSLLAVNALNAFQVRRRYGLPGVDPLAFSVAAATILGILAQAMDTSIAALALLLAATGIALVRAVQLSLRSPPAVGMK